MDWVPWPSEARPCWSRIYMTVRDHATEPGRPRPGNRRGDTPAPLCGLTLQPESQGVAEYQRNL